MRKTFSRNIFNFTNCYHRAFSDKISACIKMLTTTWCIRFRTVKMLNKKTKLIFCLSHAVSKKISYSLGDRKKSKWCFRNKNFSQVLCFEKHSKRCNGGKLITKNKLENSDNGIFEFSSWMGRKSFFYRAFTRDERGYRTKIIG